MNARNRSIALRQRLAYEAARIMVEQGVHELDRARRKAAERTGVSNRRLWPNNAEIQEALLQQVRLFQGNRHAQVLRALREQALRGMQAFAAFSPRLVGSVLTGSADDSHSVRLHLHAHTPEDVVFALIEQGIPWQEREATLRYAGGARLNHPVYAFVAGETAFELVVLPISARANPPLDSVSEHPQRGASETQVARMLEETEADGAGGSEIPCGSSE